MGLTFTIISFAMPARATSAARVARVNGEYRNARALCLVFAELSQLPESPTPHLPTHRLVEAVCPFFYALQIFKRECLFRCFGVVHQFFADTMVRVAREVRATPRQFAQSLPGAFSSDALQTPPMFTQLAPQLLDFVAGIRLAFARGSEFDNTKINSKRAHWLIGFRRFHIADHKQKPFALYQNQIAFALPRSQQHALFFAAHKRDFLTAFGCPNRNFGLVQLETQNAVVVSDGTQRFKRALRFLIQLVGVGDFGHAANNYLRGKIKRVSYRVIANFVECELAKDLMIPCQRRKKIARGICRAQSFFQRLRLFGRRLQLDLSNQLHISSIAKNISQGAVTTQRVPRRGISPLRRKRAEFPKYQKQNI